MTHKGIIDAHRALASWQSECSDERPDLSHETSLPSSDWAVGSAALRDAGAESEGGEEGVVSEAARIPESEWTWYGHPLHFVGARTCFFRMGTKVGEYVVSTVGDWSIDGNSESRELGWGRKFETMVFRARGSHAECGCPDINPEALECVGYNDAASAQAGHVEMCRKVAAGAFND